ncbi:MAG: GAF domain-containing protein, partial [Chloroflexi bacterium]|nr:GAF domain-containing protein [Chloroflexota bacterium]
MLKSVSLRVKVSLVFMLLVAIPLATLGYMAGMNSRAAIKKQVFESNQAMARMAAQLLEQYVLDARTIMLEASTRPKLRQEIIVQNWPEATKVMENFLGNFQQFDYIFVQDSKGYIRARVPYAETVGQDFSFRDFFQEVTRTRNWYVSGVYVSVAAQRPVISIAVPVLDDDGAISGVLVGALSLQGIGDLLNRVKLGEKGVVYAVDGKGKLASHPEQELVAQQVDYRSVPVVQEALAGRDGAMEYSSPEGKEKQLGAYSTVKGLGWGVVVAVPVAEAYEPAEELASRLRGIFAFCVLAALALGWVAAKAVSDPIGQLAQASRRLASGDLTSTVAVSSGDEIGELGQAFNQMAASLKMQQADLEQKVRTLAALHSASQALSKNLDLKATLEEICRVALEIMGAKMAWVGLVAEGSYQVMPVASEGFEEGYLSKISVTWNDSPHGQGPTGRAIKTKEPVLQRYIESDPEFAPWREEALKRGYRSSAAFPLLYGDRALGALNVYFDQPDACTREAASVWQAFASQAATAVKNSQLYSQIEARAQELAQEISQEKSRLETVLASIGDGVFVTDLDRRIVTWNPAAQRLTGFTAGEIRGMIFAQAMQIADDKGKPITEERYPAVIALRTRQPFYATDYSLVKANGQRIPVAISVAPILDAEGKPMGTVGVFRDISREKEIEEMKDNLISVVSHELRTPMASVLGFAELLLTHKYPQDKIRLYTEIIYKEAKRLSGLINEFLDIQRMESGKQEYCKEALDLAETARQAVDSFAGQVKLHTLEDSLPEDLPTVLADRDRISQVLTNLISNAIRYAPGGGVIRVGGYGLKIKTKQIEPLTA